MSDINTQPTENGQWVDARTFMDAMKRPASGVAVSAAMLGQVEGGDTIPLVFVKATRDAVKASVAGVVRLYVLESDRARGYLKAPLW